MLDLDEALFDRIGLLINSHGDEKFELKRCVFNN